MIRKETWIMIRNLAKQGLSKAEIARVLGIDRKTVANYLKKDSIPKYIRKKEATSKLDEFKGYVQERLEKNNLTAQNTETIKELSS